MIDASSSPMLLVLLLIALILVFGLPLGFGTYKWFQAKQRRRLERSKRPIKIETGPEVARQSVQCQHRRSRSKARTDRDEVMRSVCKWCGEPMKRNGPNDWEAIVSQPPDQLGL